MNLVAIREFCIQHGIPAEELDRLEEPPVIRDIGQALATSIQNDDAIGETLVFLILQNDDLMQRIAALESRMQALEGGAM